MVLEKLIEKKDVNLYLQYRCKELEKRKKEVESFPEQKREQIIKKFDGKITELKRLRSVMSEGKLKEECKRMWKNENLL